MKIEDTEFGTITIDGKTYAHDVVIRLSGDVIKRKKKLSKKYYGTSHMLSKDEAKFVFEKGCEQFIVGSGQMGNVRLSPEAQAYFTKKGCEVLLQPTPEAIHMFNKSHAKKIGLFHVPVKPLPPECPINQTIGSDQKQSAIGFDFANTTTNIAATSSSSSAFLTATKYWACG